MSDHQEPISTLRLNRRGQQDVARAIISGQKSVADDQCQRQLRVTFRTRRDIVVTVFQPDGSSVDFAVVPRNLSAGGMAFIHGQFLYPGSACEVTLAGEEGDHRVTGRICNVRHLTALVHEISVSFDEPIDLPRFIELNDEQRARYEKEQSLAPDQP